MKTTVLLLSLLFGVYEFALSQDLARDSVAATSAAKAPLDKVSGSGSTPLCPPVDKANMVINGLTAFGTLAACLVAIFGPVVRRWIFQPKLKVYIDNRKPMVQSHFFPEQGSDSGTQTRQVYRIRLKVCNQGRETAKGCIVCCGRLVRKGASDNKYHADQEFVPKRFLWSGEQSTTDIVPSLESYVELAELSVPETITTPQGNITATEPRLLQIRLPADDSPGQFIRVENGTLFLPLIVQADNLTKPCRCVVKIVWDGRSISECQPQHFGVGVEDDNVAAQIFKGG